MSSFVVMVVGLIGSCVCVCVFMSVFAGCMCYFIFRCVDPVMVIVFVFVLLTYWHSQERQKMWSHIARRRRLWLRNPISTPLHDDLRDCTTITL